MGAIGELGEEIKTIVIEPVEVPVPGETPASDPESVPAVPEEELWSA